MEPTDYRMPGGNRITVSSHLADEIKKRFAADRENRFQLFLLAAGLRKKYLNKRTNKYTKEFVSWMKVEQLDELFGSLSNFTKYAAAGDVVAYVAKNTSNPAKYLKRLPLSVGTLYEVSQILKDKNGKETFKVCLEFTAKRKSLSEPKYEWSTKLPALISPRTSEAVVRNWRREWNDPPPPKQQRSDKRTLPLASIMVSGELFDFDKKTGDKIGCVDLSDVEAFIKKLNKLFDEENAIQFKLETHTDYLTDGYFKRKQASDAAAKIVTGASKAKPKKRS